MIAFLDQDDLWLERKLEILLKAIRMIGLRYIFSNGYIFWRRYAEDSDKQLRMFRAADYSPFPAPHLRTSAFLIRRKVMLRLKTWDMSVKNDAYRFESGKQSMTNQILRIGLKVLIAGRNGRALRAARLAVERNTISRRSA